MEEKDIENENLFDLNYLDFSYAREENKNIIIA